MLIWKLDFYTVGSARTVAIEKRFWGLRWN